MKFIFFPALSVGPIEISLRKTPEFRFYDKNCEYFYYPHYLTSSGHNYKKENYINDVGFNKKNGIIFGDSGGYQIATGKLEYTKELRSKIFNWLENNTNLAVNLDIPAYVSNNKKMGSSLFDSALEQSLENFKYFEDNQTGKTKFLNVLHGRNIEHWNKWYNSVKDFNFNGWCIGSVSLSATLTLQGLFYLLMKGEFENSKNKFVHILGTSKADVFIYMIYFSYLVNKLRGYKGYITSDSSSPNKGTAFGTYYTSHDFVSFKAVQLTNKFKLEEHINPKGKMPCNCKVCDSNTLGDFYQWNTKSYSLMTLHNLKIFLDYVEDIKKIMSCDYDEMIYSYFPASIVKNLKLIRKCFDVKNPIELIQKHHKQFDIDNNVDIDTMNSFF